LRAGAKLSLAHQVAIITRLDRGETKFLTPLAFSMAFTKWEWDAARGKNYYYDDELHCYVYEDGTQVTVPGRDAKLATTDEDGCQPRKRGAGGGCKKTAVIFYTCVHS
jgi:hypothetical protein